VDNRHKQYVDERDPKNPWFTDGTLDMDRVVGENPAGGGEYPKMLYRASSTGEKVHGHLVETVTVETEDAEEALMVEGWRQTPDKASKVTPRVDAVDLEEAQAPRRGPGRPPKNLLATDGHV